MRKEIQRARLHVLEENAQYISKTDRASDLFAALIKIGSKIIEKQ